MSHKKDERKIGRWVVQVGANIWWQTLHEEGHEGETFATEKEAWASARRIFPEDKYLGILIRVFQLR